MVKALNLLLISLLLSLNTCTEDDYKQYCENYEDDPTKPEDCNNRKINPNDEDDKYCCFEEYGNEKSCGSYSQEAYDKIDDIIEAEEKVTGLDISIDCGSDYIMISLLSLIILFL